MTDFEKNVTEESFYKGKPCPDFKIHLLNYHPGVPGYSVVYKYDITFKGEHISAKGCNLQANLPDIWFKQDEIIIPDHVRQTGETLVISLYCSFDHDYTATLKIKLRKYELTLQDNFESYNTYLWSPCTYGAKMPMAFTKVKDNYVRDGKLCLDFEKNETPIIRAGRECYYSDAGVKTEGKFSQKYGCFTARMKIPEFDCGVFSAFWLMPEGKYTGDYFFKRTDTGDDFHGCSEIDIMEIFDNPTTRGSSHTEHYWEPNWNWEVSKTKSSIGYDYTIPGFKHGDYQEYACVWNEYGIYYYVNGVLARQNINIEPVENVVNAYVLFTCYIGPEGSGAWWGEIEDKYLPQTTKVDWLKVYK